MVHVNIEESLHRLRAQLLKPIVRYETCIDDKQANVNVVSENRVFQLLELSHACDTFKVKLNDERVAFWTHFLHLLLDSLELRFRAGD